MIRIFAKAEAAPVRYVPLLLTGMLLFLAGCAGNPGAGKQTAAKAPLPANHGRYSINQDRAPSRPLDPSLIREVIPQPLSRTLAGNRSPYSVNGKSYRVMASEEGYSETGYASWYGEKFHGHRTSNGEVFDMYQISAAHKSLPIPSFLRVTNLENNQSIIVRVNDRGPFHGDRIIDLSYAAAWKLGFSDRGTARVHVEAVVPSMYNPGSSPTRVVAAVSSGARPAEMRSTAPAPVAAAAAGGKYLQVGAFSDLEAARQVSDKVQRMTSNPVFIRSVQTDSARPVLHRVRIGPIADPGEIDRLTALVVDADLGKPYAVEE